jgi:hypothetical protein
MSAIQIKTSSILVAGIIVALIGIFIEIINYFLMDSLYLTGIGIAAIVLGLAGIASGSSEKTSSNSSSRIKTRLLITLAIVLGAANSLFFIFNQNDLSILFIADSIIYFIITLAFVNLDSRSKAALNGVGALIFVAFLVVVVLKVFQIMK